MKFNSIMVLTIAVAVLSAGGCGKKNVNTVTVAGSTAFQPFAEKLADQFMALRPDIRVTVQGGGSALGIQSALSGAAQIGMADMVKLPPEAEVLTSVAVARDGIALIINPANKISGLSMEQVRGVFAGTIANWKDLGGEDQPIRVVSREAGSGTRSSFEKLIGGIKLVGSAIIQDSNGTLRETVANDRNTIGYVSHGLLNEKVTALKVDGFACTEEEIAKMNYKLVRPVFLLTKGEPIEGVKAFIEYMLSADGQAMIKKDGLLPAK